MFFWVQLILASFFAFLALAFAGSALYVGHPWDAFSFLLAGILAAGFVLFGFSVKDIWQYQAMLALFAGTSFVAVFSYQPAFDLDYVKVQPELIAEFARIDNTPTLLSPDERILAKNGIAACAYQNISDTLDAISELNKAEHFGPIMTLLDKLSSTVDPDPKVMSCIDYYVVLHRNHPSIFIINDKGLEKVASRLSGG